MKSNDPSGVVGSETDDLQAHLVVIIPVEKPLASCVFIIGCETCVFIVPGVRIAAL